MSGYTPVFSTIYQGTLCGKWPDAAVWASLLPLCDRNGRIDYTPQAIAALTGWPLELLTQGLTGLCQPDPHSRSDSEGGCRLKLIDPARSWGWVVVNHGKYREKARLTSREAERVSSGANRARMAERRTTPDDPRSPPPTHPQTQTQTQTKIGREARKRALPPEFDLSPEREAYAREAGVADPRASFAHFRDHFTANGQAMKDWDATWRNWCRREKQFTRSTPNRGDPKPHHSPQMPEAERARAARTLAMLKEGKPQ